MIELVFTACLVAAPDACEERSLTFLAQSGPVACLVQAPPELAAWVGQHPGYTIAAWRCQDPGGRPTRA
jgi:hypothetical protein